MKKPSPGEKLLCLFFPARCLRCGKPVPAGGLFCAVCKGDAPQAPFRRRYSLPGAGAQGFSIVSPLPYAGGYRKTLHALKFYNKKALARPLGRLAAQTAADLGERFDAVTWVPMTNRKKRQRGYNQSQLLAKEIARNLGIPCLALLTKTRETGTQHDLPRQERGKNVKGAYQAIKIATGKSLLLVDDIVTTGFTLMECAGALYAAGAAKVTGLCAADSLSPAKGTPAEGNSSGKPA